MSDMDYIPSGIAMEDYTSTILGAKNSAIDRFGELLDVVDDGSSLTVTVCRYQGKSGVSYMLRWSSYGRDVVEVNWPGYSPE